MRDLSDNIALVTGATSGIGGAIAADLARRGVTLCLVGRNREKLERLSEQLYAGTSRIYAFQADLTVDEEIESLSSSLHQVSEHLDILVHSAGVFSMGSCESSSIEDLDLQYRTNVRAPYLLTQSLLPLLRQRRGQIVFINSSAGVAARALVGQYSASKHALKAFADSLRQEVNGEGIRVISIFPGRTATPMQARVHEMEGKEYLPERLMKPQDVAEVVADVLSLPLSAEVTDIHIRPSRKD
jgi:NADP-dependent 3-hydroxy acid dehydrogenase YdfG